MKNILIIGRSDHDNFGDSLMFMFYIKKLIELGCNAFIYKPSDIFMKRINDEGLICSVFNEGSHNIDCAFFIGGGYFGEPDIGAKSWSDRFVKDSFFFKAAKFLIDNDIKYYVHGVEVGPLNDFKVMEQVSFILKNAEDIIVRNLNSQEFCKKKLGVNVGFCRDVVLYESNHYCDGIASPAGLVLHATGKFLKKNPISWVFRKKIINFVKSSKISSIKILFDQSEYSELLVRAEIFKKQLELSSECAVDVIQYSGVSDVISHVRASDRLITSKLHLGMVGLSVGCQVLCISNMPKNIRFYNEVFSGSGIVALLTAAMPWFQIKDNDFVKMQESNNAHFKSSKDNVLLFSDLVR